MHITHDELLSSIRQLRVKVSVGIYDIKYKIKYSVCVCMDDKNEHLILVMEYWFCYLGDMLNADGCCNSAVGLESAVHGTEF